jgi:hypothetical protein
MRKAAATGRSGEHVERNLRLEKAGLFSRSEGDFDFAYEMDENRVFAATFSSKRKATALSSA